MRITRLDKIVDDEVAIGKIADTGTLGQKLGLLRVMSPDNIHRQTVGTSILTEMLSRHRRIDHREHPLMIGYFSTLGFEVAHLKTGEGDMSDGTTSIERKEDDFMDSLFDDRWLRQLGAMREEAEHSFLVVTKSYNDIKNEVSERGVSEQVLTGFIAALCAVGYIPLFVDDKWDASVIMRKIMDKIVDDTSRLYVPRPRSPKASAYRNAVIESFPKIGIKTRRKIVAEYPSLADLTTATVESLMGIEGIGKKTAERIYEILNAND
jgi:ERCC4-type nuclease|tara:strand:- start:3644 stop:4438 length:795 start_codon:yes stop_codon:yes gene_type:complete